MVVDISGLSYFMPIYGFLFVFVLIYAILQKTKILGDNKFISLIISFILATIFATVSSMQAYVSLVTPWFIILIVALFFILLIVGFSLKKVEGIISPGFIWVFVAVLILVFLISAIKVFAPFNSVWGNILHFINSYTLLTGTIIFIVITGLVAWVISKK